MFSLKFQYDRCSVSFFFLLFTKAINPRTGRVDVSILTTGVSSFDHHQRVVLVQTLKNYLKENRNKWKSNPIRKDFLFNEIRNHAEQRIGRELFDDAIRSLEEENIIIASQQYLRLTAQIDSKKNFF